MRHSGYELLVAAEQDPDELVSHGGDLRVRGRGTSHQVDVLGEFAFTPAFSLPVRLFLEAKFYRTKCKLQVVRNAHGTLADVNQNFVARPGSRPRRRFQYCYALFSANGFSAEAEAYALAHQISLIDLSIPGFAWLLKVVADGARRLHAAATLHGVTTFPVGVMRSRLRLLLGTASTPPPLQPEVQPPQFAQDFDASIDGFVARLQQHADAELLLGFPPAPFVLPLAIEHRDTFISYALAHPSHSVLLKPARSMSAEWEARPTGEPDRYRLTFSLPRGIETWIMENEDRRRGRVRSVKNNFLSTITVYYEYDSDLRVCHLRYQPGELAR